MSIMTPTLPDILAWLQVQTPIAQLSSDSRSIKLGDIFFAYPGDAADGRSYIDAAIENGAKAIVYEAQGFTWNAALKVPHLAVTDLQKHAGEIAGAYYAHPDADMFVVAVTGTNGKTSCTQWIGSALSQLGEPTAVIGTLGVGLYNQGLHGEFQPTGYTTPDAVLLQRHLAEMRDAGAKALAIEASSIGLHQGRMNGLHCDVALFTNFTRDHLDYHGDMAAYEAAKTALFNWPGLKHAIVNLDDPMGLRLVEYLKKTAPSVAIIGTTLTNQIVQGITVLYANDIRMSQIGTTFHLTSPSGTSIVKTQLVGQFNVSNAIGIVGVLLAKSVPWRTAIDSIELLTAVPGRMQQLGGNDAPLVVIDYAHTPDALEKTLDALRPIAEERNGQLWCVFGCGGDRDPGKRAQMGAASLVADHVIVTSDNPRSENPADIIAQIVAGMQATSEQQADIQTYEDRAAAILSAVKHAGKQDVILLAGKGHETTQEIKGRKLSFLDADHAALALAARATMKGAH
ncbi:MAG TPA: UDP-N-acetylmuramoyl-L-alanyl-D-glutamate--2,6-diaminopimelate ligase [Burkholderiaceae bacterium]|jgi:UDP-N-acetylmuramoyl-L-alanyl-D-glutamate--2,6-diaminopimelate ligase